ncbi:MAG: hypothetical protein ABIO39_00365 [Caulobacteraceae bacterium]
MSAQLSIVASTPERPSARASRLMAEARAAAREQVAVLEQAMADVIALANEIGDGGDAYSPGARDLCRRLAEEVAQRGQTLGAIVRSSY